MTSKILIAEDNNDLRKLYRDFVELTFPGEIEVHEAENGRQLLEHAKNGHKYALIISDDDMPEINGLEALMQLRREGLKSKMIMITGIRRENRREQLEASGIDYVEKPLKHTKFLEIVRTNLAKYASENASSTTSLVSHDYHFEI